MRGLVRVRPSTSAARPRDEEAEFAEHLRRHSCAWFAPEGGGVPGVTLEWKRVRTGSTLYAFRVATETARKRILVKVLPVHDDAQPPTGDPTKDRPRLARALGLDADGRCRREFEALAILREHIQSLGDPRFGAVAVYEALPAKGAVVMELVPRPSLRDLVAFPWRRPESRTASELALLFRNAGSWLKMYHGLARPEPLRTRHTRRDEFIAFNLEVTEFLARAVGHPSFFRRVAERLERAAPADLPEALPSGLGHGDYALRNVLAGPDGAVTVIDTKGGFRTPIYEDIGTFVVDLKCNMPQVLTRGRILGGRVALFEREFLEGYFGGSIPTSVVRLYELQACLDKWASIAAQRRRVQGLAPNLFHGLRLRLATTHFRSIVENLLEDVPA